MIRDKDEVSSSGEKINWNKHLSAEEFKAAELMKNILQANNNILWQQASEEKHLFMEAQKDPYDIAISTDPKSKSEIYTDGKKVKGSAYPLAGIGDMQSYKISGYNFIILKQHLPNPKGKGNSDSWYQTVVCKTYGLKLYAQSLLGLPMG